MTALAAIMIDDITHSTTTSPALGNKGRAKMTPGTTFTRRRRNNDRCLSSERSVLLLSLLKKSSSLTFMVVLMSLFLLMTDTGSGIGLVDGAVNPTLPFGDINILVVTDVHSWVGGHGRKEPNLNADYGHVLSFYQRLKEYWYNHPQHGDLFFVMNGDWIDGTGLAMNGDPSYLVPILYKMPFDLVNIGNHELYDNDVVDYMLRPGGFVEWWGHRMLSSNIDRTISNEAVGNRYRLLKGRNATVLSFGFLYDMKNNADHVTVQSVETSVQASWFKNALFDETYDAILVLAHMDVQDDLVRVILEKIRSYVGDDVPVQFITGHTHIRSYAPIDNSSTSFEAGKYLDTIGFVSFPKKSTLIEHRSSAERRQLLQQEQDEVQQRLLQQQAESITSLTNEQIGNGTTTTNNGTATATTTMNNTTTTTTIAESSAPNPPATTATNAVTTIPPAGTATTAPPTPTIVKSTTLDLFRHVFIDASVNVLKETLGFTDNAKEDLYTDDGEELSNMIDRTRDDLGLNEKIGCVKGTYYATENRTLTDPDSLWKFFKDNIVPTQFEDDDVIMLQKGSWRYDLIDGDQTLDDIIAVSPFNESYIGWRDVAAEIIHIVNQSMNVIDIDPSIPDIPSYVLAIGNPPFQRGTKNTTYNLLISDFMLDEVRQHLIDAVAKANMTSFNATEAPIPWNRTSTDIWINFFKQQRGCFRSSGDPSVWNSDSNGRGGNYFGNMGDIKDSLGLNSITDEQVNKLIIGFIVTAVTVVLVLTGVSVRQRAIIYKREMAARDHATMQALREMQDEEGEFV